MMKGGVRESTQSKVRPGKEKLTLVGVLGEKLPWLRKRKHDI